MATALAAVTSRIRFLIAIRPGFIAAGLLAQMVATLDQIGRGRVDINIVPGGVPETSNVWGSRSTTPGAMHRPRS
jgi:alkanesulfonate monooxygenase